MNNEWEREQRTSGWIHIDITLTRINMKRIFFVLAARSSIHSLTNRVDKIVQSAVLDRLHHLHLLWEFRIARKLPLNLNCTRPQCTNQASMSHILLWLLNGVLPTVFFFRPLCTKSDEEELCTHFSYYYLQLTRDAGKIERNISRIGEQNDISIYSCFYQKKNRTPDVLFHFSRDIYVIVCVCVGVACSSSTTVDTITYVCCLSSSSMEAYFGRNDSCDADDWMRYDWFGEKKIFISFFDGENIDRWFGVSVFVCRGRLYRNHKHEK